MTELTHFDEHGASRMVDTSAKPETLREAKASGLVRMAPATAALIRDRALAKGDVLEVSRLAGIMAAKRTGDLIPLCHPLPLTSVTVDFSFPPSPLPRRGPALRRGDRARLRPHRRRDGGADRRQRRRPDRLRHVQGGGPCYDGRARAVGVQERRPQRHLPARRLTPRTSLSRIQR